MARKKSELLEQFFSKSKKQDILEALACINITVLELKIVVRSYLDGLTAKEIAEEMNLVSFTVEKIKQRACKKIEKYLFTYT